MPTNSCQEKMLSSFVFLLIFSLLAELLFNQSTRSGHSGPVRLLLPLKGEETNAVLGSSLCV